MIRLRSATPDTPSRQHNAFRPTAGGPSQGTGRSAGGTPRISAHLQSRDHRNRRHNMDVNVDMDLRNLVHEHPEGAFGIPSEDAYLT